MRCNCENSHCPICDGHGCKKMAGRQRAMYIGAICDDCARHMPDEYLLPNMMVQTHQVQIEVEIPLREDHFMVEAEFCYELLGPWDDEGTRWPVCKPWFDFKLFQYNELVQNYEIPINDSLTAEENVFIQNWLNEYWNDLAASAAEARYDRD